MVSEWLFFWLSPLVDNVKYRCGFGPITWRRRWLVDVDNVTQALACTDGCTPCAVNEATDSIAYVDSLVVRVGLQSIPIRSGPESARVEKQ